MAAGAPAMELPRWIGLILCLQLEIRHRIREGQTYVPRYFERVSLHFVRSKARLLLAEFDMFALENSFDHNGYNSISLKWVTRLIYGREND